MTLNIPLPVWEAAVFLALAVAVWQVPKWQTKTFTEELEPKDRANLEDANRRTFIQFLGGLFFFVTAYLSWRNLQTAEDKEVNDRFSKAVELLGDDRLEVRLGGIYLLERIAKDSARDHWTVMEVLTSYIREKSPVTARSEILKTDIQAALTVIGRRNVNNDSRTKQLYLQDVSLRGADLSEANFDRANLNGSELSDATLERVTLRGANLKQVRLVGANLVGSILDEADLNGAVLRGANLAQANLIGAVLLQANLREASFDKANLGKANLIEAQLQQASFVGANLGAANLIGADFADTSLTKANLARSDLRSATNLLPEQIQMASQWEAAVYDVELQEQLGLNVMSDP
ncbi:MAG: pentapeptide repeat-containing protein [Cyanobacteria bacterium P01_A01_bin.17]